ncbi:D-inositol-3-phosphate glycosyltransferase [Prochlorococcus marinus str. MIT 1342]|uniref:glycosyltransferase family 4 protein n=1 Tax=Prochlorococcus TaxID=1218 RepID=UPI0007B36E27|nr:glycosyltransferase family 4 protein [Prochlorococcus marinus]KZR79890.1 D-inositol-3-phosphate glycosyltransferase [Prochlorococcus marinus str. MIT 1342]
MRKALIDWPLTPYTGWGNYGIQLAQALMDQGCYQPVLVAPNDRTKHCDLHWLAALEHLELGSKSICRSLEEATNKGSLPLPTSASVAFSPLGNVVPPPRCQAQRHVGVTFFECSDFSKQQLEILQAFDLVVTGSRWNQSLLTQLGISQAQLVHQGVDTGLFNPAPVPTLIKRSIVIFSGGKLETRKGQDIVIAAFRRLLGIHPDALLIAAWGNVGNVAIETIGCSPYVTGAPKEGRSKGIAAWLDANGVPDKNVWVLPCVVNRQLPNLIKQADVAVFASRCEGGTNLMAMETLACGVPTVVSANTGHLDLLDMGMGHCLSVGDSGVGCVNPDVVAPYGRDNGGFWGETDPEELLQCWLKVASEKGSWRQQGQQQAAAMQSMSWNVSMKRLMNLLKEFESP